MIGLVLAVGVVALIAVLLRRRYVAVTVDGPSMEPTLHSGDLVVVRRARLRSVRAGQIVVFRQPPAGRSVEDWVAGRRASGIAEGSPARPRWVIKRAAAVPGEALPGPLAAHVDRLGRVVPAGSLAVLGDNPARSADSRHHGYVDGAELLGVVIRRPGARPARPGGRLVG